MEKENSSRLYFPDNFEILTDYFDDNVSNGSYPDDDVPDTVGINSERLKVPKKKEVFKIKKENLLNAIETRRERNRLAAQRCRSRQRNRIETLEQVRLLLFLEKIFIVNMIAKVIRLKRLFLLSNAF